MNVDADADEKSNADVDAGLGVFVRVLSIDPGVTGALAVIQSPAAIGKPPTIEAIHDLPSYAEKTSTGRVKNYVDPCGLADLIQALGKVDQVICERLTAPPGIASTVAYSLGATSGTIGTVLKLAGYVPKLVSPSVWKRALDCPADKELARQFATRLFGSDEYWQRKKQHNRAEAALIGAWLILSK